MANERETFAPGIVFHVLHHGNANDNIFVEDANYHYFLQLYRQYISPIADTYSYCLMPNHFHFALKFKDEAMLKRSFANKVGLKNFKGLMLTEEEVVDIMGRMDNERLSKLMASQFSHWLNAYAKAFNNRYGRVGSLFRDSVRRQAVESDEYLRQLVKYIHLNPVKHGFAKNLKLWPHSSIHAYESSAISQLERDKIYALFGGKDVFWQEHGYVEPIDFEILD